jgi:hypothetical protein
MSKDLKTGLIRTNETTFIKLLDSKVFAELVLKGTIGIVKSVHGKRTSFLPESDEAAIKDTNRRRYRHILNPIKPKSEEQKNRVRPRPGGKPTESTFRQEANVMTITSAEIVDGNGYIEFESKEFPIDILRILSVAAKGPLSIIYLDEERNKKSHELSEVTHTEIDKNGDFEYKVCNLEDLKEIFENKKKKKISPINKNDGEIEI